MGTKYHNPQHTESELGQTFCQYYCRLARPTQSTLMGQVSIKILERIESFAADNPESAVARLQADMLQAIGSDTVAGDRTPSRASMSYTNRPTKSSSRQPEHI